MAVEVAKKLLEINLTPQQITEATGLPITEDEKMTLQSPSWKTRTRIAGRFGRMG